MFDRPGRIALLAALALAACGRSPEPVRIGVAGPFDEPQSVPIKLAAELAVEEINASGGIDGRPLALVERNDYANPDSAVFVATDLYDAGVSAVIGHVYSGTTLAAAPVYGGGPRPVVVISPSSTAPAVSRAGPYVFRVCPSDLAHGSALARWVRDRLRLRVGAVLYLNDEYGRGVRQTFVEAFLRLGGRLTSVDPYLGATPEVGPYLDRMSRGAHPEFLLVAGNKDEAHEILRQARRRGLMMPVVGGDALDGIQEAGALAEGVYQSSAYFPFLSTPANRRFVAAYQRKFPDAGAPNSLAASTYDVVYLLRDVIGRVGNGREAVRRGLAAVGSGTPPFPGVTGPIAFDSAGDVPTQRVYVGVVRSGAMQPAEGE